MKMLAFVLFAGVASAARLENTYLPPDSARFAGGNGNFLATPSNLYVGPSNVHITPSASTFQKQSSFGQFAQHSSFGPARSAAPSSSYGAPIQRHSEPSPVYGPASGANFRASSADAHANTLRFDNDNDGTGNYRFEFETENKISQQEQGQLKQGAEGEATVVRGSYSYVGDDGKTYTVNYIADENGFQPTGEHIDSAISMAAADAARSAITEGQQGYNYNAQQGYNGQRSQHGGNGGYQY